LLLGGRVIMRKNEQILK